MILLELAVEFFKVGLFALGGGPATLPFLMDLAETKGWFTMEQLTQMIAISESTPGPLGVNMATYAGFTTAGIVGGIVATAALVLPSIIIIMIVANFLKAYKGNPIVEGAFYGIRPAVTGLIGAAILGIWEIALWQPGNTGLALVNWPIFAIVAVFFVLMNLKPLKKLHPVLWLLAGAVIGVVFQL